MKSAFFFFLAGLFLGLAPAGVADEIGDLIGTLNRADGVSRQISRKTSDPFSTSQCSPDGGATATAAENFSQRETTIFEHRGLDVKMTVLTKEEAQKIFDDVVQPKTRKMELRDFRQCKQRAEKLAYEMHEKGIQSGKFFVTRRMGTLSVNSKALEPYFDGVPYHVSNVVAVKGDDGKPEMYVMDPFLFPNGPVPKKEFEKVFPTGLLQSVDLGREYSYDISERFDASTSYRRKDLAETNSVLDGHYVTDSPVRRVMSVSEREEYLRRRAEELKH
jgi:hypothetical protein